MRPIVYPVLRKLFIITLLLTNALLLLSFRAFTQSICSDTIKRSRYYLNPDTSITVYKNFLQTSGNSYFVGKAWQTNSTIFNSVLIKKDQWENQLWQRIITTTNEDSSLVIEQVLELSDQSVLAFANVQSASPPFRESPAPLLLHFGSNGVVINSWRVDLKETSNINGFFRSFMCQIDAGSVAILINYASEDFTSAFIVLKVDVATGNCIWTNKFYKNNFFYVNGMAALGNELVIASNFSTGSSSQIKQGINLVKINSINGSLLTNKSYENTFVTTLPTADFFGTIRLLSNNNLKLVYSTSKDNAPNKIIDACFDSNFNIVSINATANIPDNYLVRNYSIANSGTFAFGFFNASNLNDQGYIAVDSTGKLIQQRKLKPPSNGNFTALFSNNDLTLANDHKLTVFTAVNRSSKIEFEFVTANVFNKDTGCAYFIFNEAITESFSLQNSPWSLDQINNSLPLLYSYSVKNDDVITQQEQVCITIKNYDLALPWKLIKCNDDSVLLKASSNFTSYNWQPGTSLIQINDSTVKAFPSTTTDYSLVAETYWGCEMKDTTMVVAARSPVINLGNDSSICEGSTIKLNAGSGFISYVWDDGSTNSYKYISNAGSYFVYATDANGCMSADTLNLLKLYPKPIINIHQRESLCKGQSDILTPGAFESYLWQDGSTSQNFTVTKAGEYWVSVTDQNGCASADTAFIRTIFDPPSDFLIHDTSICEYETLEIKPLQSFSNYLWSTGSVSKNITINKAGTYWLEATDKNGCTVKEYIDVISKPCTQQIYFPSAFTPNGDGKNEIFKPAVRGAIEQYEFSIFDRWGQRVFTSKDVLKGWDGTISGKTQETGIFIWICKYMFKNQSPKFVKGSILLVR